MVVESMRSFMKLDQVKDDTPGELGTKAIRLSALDFPEEVRENAAIQAELVDLYVNVLKNACISQRIIKEAPVR